ncbi:MAG: hypothetical protein AAFZ80_02445 [Cyanobacteria bacterium P01_A01_bin.105]
MQILGLGALLLGLAACNGASTEPAIELAPVVGDSSPDAADPSAADDEADGADDVILTHPPEAAFAAAVLEASFTGEPDAYQASVTLQSPDTGCEQYADWWEVLSADGDLLYRRILAHSHVEEQPFTRSGGPVEIAPNQLIFIRVHMNNTGYSDQVLQGTVADGLRATTLRFAPDSDAAVAAQSPQPAGCAF